MSADRVSYREWLTRVLAWDLVLPAFIAFVPAGVELLLPNRRGVTEVIAVELPIAALLARLRIGRRQIGSNRCSGRIRSWQFALFRLGVVPLWLRSTPC